ncbi:hypothetical protein V3528_09835 [Acinetobacter johnsonii]|uniref:hypothetical protein n=1 Tax=Acinetobacter TaxID=469 RepID=UPI001C453804|nr:MULTISPECIES: hypothetical protein [Acinetobacter]MBV7308417.1 hypothetical protein [Acinetobacter sp. CWB-G5]MDH1364113.1 hypothetical protein [Acinetobacter johnsonii]
MSSVQHNNPKLLWGITAGLVAIIAIFALYQWLFAAQESTTPVHQAELIQPTVKALPEAEKAASTAMADNTIKLVEEDILKAPVPENASLAKEEVAKLEDIQSQLKEQEKSLQAQHKDADELVKLKEEQIKLLEAQLAAQ